MREEVRTRPASRDEVPELARCLTAALADDPFLRWSSAFATVDLRAFFSGYLRGAFDKGFSTHRTAKLHPEVFWSARTLYLRYIRWSGELVPGGQDAVERLREQRLRAHICGSLTIWVSVARACSVVGVTPEELLGRP